MKVTSHDARVNGILRDLRGEEWIHNCTINIECSANYLLAHANAIFAAIQQVMPPFKHSVITIAKGVVYSHLCLIDDPMDGAAWDGVELDDVHRLLTPAPAPVPGDDSDDLPF